MTAAILRLLSAPMLRDEMAHGQDKSLSASTYVVRSEVISTP